MQEHGDVAATRVDPGERRAMVIGLQREAEDIISVYLRATDTAAFPHWQPGSHIDLHLPNGRTRQYSLVPHGEGSSVYRITALREAVSRGGSEYIHSFLRIGQLVTITGPRNHFELSAGPRFLFIAGGIGITPLMSMIQAVDAAGGDWRLIYGSRTRGHFSFAEQLANFGERVSFFAQDEVGHMPFETLLRGETSATHIHACGPGPMLDALIAVAEKRGLTLHLERFAPTIKKDLVNIGHDVVCSRSNTILEVPPEQSFLSALQAAGVPVASSCATGVCGTCEVRVLEGHPDHRDDILSEEAAAKGDRMYVCVSRATTKRIVLDV